jgi:Uma2 family endonuclease
MDTVEAGLLAENPWVTRRKITVHEYHEMGKAGILHEDDRVELIEGELVAMAPIGTEHHGATDWLTQALVRAIGDRGIVRVQGSIRLDDRSEPQPDFCILRPRADYYRKTVAMPPDVFFLVEIAHSSLRFDRSIKRPLYARAGVPEYWIVNLVDGEVEICRQPGKADYASVTVAGRGQVIEPALLPGVAIPVSDLLG